MAYRNTIKVGEIEKTGEVESVDDLILIIGAMGGDDTMTAEGEEAPLAGKSHEKGQRHGK